MFYSLIIAGCWRAPRLAARCAPILVADGGMGDRMVQQRQALRDTAKSIEVYEPPQLRVSAMAYGASLAAGAHVPLALAQQLADEAER